MGSLYGQRLSQMPHLRQVATFGSASRVCLMIPSVHPILLSIPASALRTKEIGIPWGQG